MAYIAKRKAASESESASKSKSKKPKVVADGSVPAISGKTGPAHKPLKKSAAKPVSKPQIQEVHSDDEDDGFDGFTSDEEDGGVAIDSPAEENGHTSAKQNASSATNSNKSRESHQKQKELAAARKASKPYADDIARAKKLWERLRLKSHVQKEERQKLVAELFDIITGRVKDFVFKHDSVRVIQCAVKYSTIVQKKEIAKELKGTYRSLAESKYAKFLLAKIITEGDEETKNLIIPEFYGHVKRLINHPEASWILDDIYRSVANKEQKAIILRELYGPEFALFKHDSETKLSPELSQIIKHSPEKKGPIMDFLHERINHLVQKKMTGFTLLHDAMFQYFQNLSPGSDDFVAFVRLVIGDTGEEEADLLKNLAFTRSGSDLICQIFAYSSAKDRRQILKTYKDVFEMLAYDKFGHKLLLTAFECMDDIREVVSRVYSELYLVKKTDDPEQQAEKIVNLATNSIGHVVLIYPFVGIDRKIFRPHDMNWIRKVQEIRKTTSKKDPEIRRSELLAPLTPLCLKAFQIHAPDILASSFGCLFATEVMLDSSGDKTVAASAIAAVAAGDPLEKEHLVHSPFFGKLLKSLVAGGRWDRVSRRLIPLDPPLYFADTLFEVIKPELAKWITGDGGFVILAMLEGQWADENGKKIVQNAVKSEEATLKKAVKGDGMEATAAKHLLQALK